MARLTGKIILVTGAASGLGAAMSTKFIAEGARVLLTDINAVGAAAKAAELGANAASFGHDVTDPAQWEAALAKPAAWSWAEAASLPEAWLTAWLNLMEVAHLQAGETALIHAGASGVGAAAIQLARWRGARVIATCGSADKAAFCQALGADAVVNYRKTPDLAAAIRALGRADVALDCVGGPYLDAHLQCLNQDGRLVVIGVMGGAQATLNLGLLLVKRIRVMGSTLRSQPLARRAALARALAEHILPAFVRGELRWTLDRQFALPDAAQAHAWVEGNHNKGKVMLLA